MIYSCNKSKDAVKKENPVKEESYPWR